jgi:hypothetical protein
VTLFRQSVDTAFTGALPATEYLERVRSAVRPLGFTPERTLTAVSLCRDELAQSLTRLVAEHWGAPFCLGGLGGLPDLGPFGWAAVLSHVPDSDGRGRLLVLGMPHIGIDADGMVGQCLRPSQKEPTSACGAINSLLAPSSIEVADAEEDREARRLLRLLGPCADGAAPDLVELTRRAATEIEASIWSALDALDAQASTDIAVFCGVQVHAPDGDLISPTGGAVLGIDGHKVAVAI